jgi:6-phosphogluconolactonase
MPLTVEVLAEADAVLRRGAEAIAAEARAAIASRGRFVFAASGGRTPLAMWRALAGQDVSWPHAHVCQVDERVAPAGHPDRNWTGLVEALLDRAALPPQNAHPMPVEDADLEAAAARYAATLARVAGAPPVLDLVHLGLGADGHTASLVPGDPALGVADADVAATAPYQGRRRMTLTLPVLSRARRVLWVVTGADKRAALARLLRGDPAIPASQVRCASMLLLADRAAAGEEAA